MCILRCTKAPFVWDGHWPVKEWANKTNVEEDHNESVSDSGGSEENPSTPNGSKSRTQMLLTALHEIPKNVCVGG